MKIFGINFVTKKELKEQIFDLEMTVEELKGELAMRDEKYPLELGETVYDVALKNAQGKYTKTKPSLEYSTISEVVVDEKNYFTLVKRLKRNDIFTEREKAEDYLADICLPQ